MDTPSQGAAIDVSRLGRSGSKTFGKFTIVGRLGRGGMGIVLDAMTPEGVPVALKLIRPTGDTEKQRVFSARLYREAKILRKLTHPGVVRLVDSGNINGILYLAMARVEGKSLGALLKRGAMDAEVVISLGIKIADTLAHLHELGVVHRDIKPDNVIIDGGGQPILTDFGLARLSGSTAITRKDELVGSLGYIAPEIVEGKEPSPRTDQYALGRLLFTLGAGEPPRNPDDMPLLEQLGQSLRIDWSRFPSDGLFGPLRPVLRHMIRTNPDNRYPDMYSCIVALDALRPKDQFLEAKTDKQPLPRRPSHDWSAQPDSDPKANSFDNWDDDTKYQPEAPSISMLTPTPWLASDLGSPAALPAVDLALVDPDSENGPLFADGVQARIAAPKLLTSTPNDDVASATDTRDLILKMRKRTQILWSELESHGLNERGDPVEQLRKRTQAYLQAHEPADNGGAPDATSIDLSIPDAARALAEWSHIVDDLVPPAPAVDLEHADTIPAPPPRPTVPPAADPIPLTILTPVPQIQAGPAPLAAIVPRREVVPISGEDPLPPPRSPAPPPPALHGGFGPAGYVLIGILIGAALTTGVLYFIGRI